MIDGVAGVDLMVALLRMNEDARIPESPPFEPRPIPHATELLQEELKHRAQGPRRLLDTIRRAQQDPDAFWERAHTIGDGLKETLGTGLTPATATPLTVDRIGPHRRFDWLEMDLNRIKAIKSALGGTINDAVLAIVTGALRQFFTARGVNPDLIGDFRALVPVATRNKAAHGRLGNRVAMLLASLPLADPDPAERFATIHETLAELKHSPSIQSTTLMEEIGDVTGSSLITQSLRLASKIRAYNIVVTNVPGPPFPLYLLGCRLRATFPLVPLFAGQTVGLAIFSYDGQLCWGLGADWQ